MIHLDTDPRYHPAEQTLVTPTFGEVRAHLKAGGTVEQFWHSDQRWHELRPTGQTTRAWERYFSHTTTPAELVRLQHGIRLCFPLPPKTERVALHRVIGRRLASHPDLVIEAVEVETPLRPYTIIKGRPTPRPGRAPQRVYETYASPLVKTAHKLGEDGKVEVLVKEPVESAYRLSILAEEDRITEALKADWNRVLTNHDATVRYVEEQRAAGDPAAVRAGLNILERERAERERPPLSTREHVSQAIQAHEAVHHIQQSAFEPVDAMNEVLRRARSYARAARSGYDLRAARADLERAAARLR